MTTQPWITSHPTRPNPLQSEIEDFMGSFSFEAVHLFDVPLFYSPILSLIVADAHNQNVLRDENEKLSPIDLVIGPPGPELLAEIRKWRQANVS